MTSSTIDPVVPFEPFEPYDEAAQLRAPRGRQLRELLEEDERRSAEYTGELARLQQELSKQTKDTTDMVKYLEAEVRRKDLMSKRMNQQLTDLCENHTDDLAMMKKQFEHTCKFMEKIFMDKEKTILDKNNKLQTQIKDLSELQKQRTELATELEQTKYVIFANERTHKLQLDELEKKFLSARDGLQQEAANRIAQSRATYKLEVGKELEEESTAVRLENEKLRERLKTHEATSDRLQKDHSHLTQRIHELKQDLELRQQQNEEYLKKSIKQGKTIEQLTKETKQMEENLLQSLKKRDEMKYAEESKQLELVEPLRLKLQQAKSQAAEVDRVNKQLRREARRVLKEKKDTERFFLTALEETRANLTRKKELQKREKELLQQAQLRELTLPVVLRTRLPFIHSSNDHSAPYPPNIFNNPATGMELGDLTLEDREKVLRLLYAKISHTPTGLTVTLPPHSFDIQLTQQGQPQPQLLSSPPQVPLLQMPHESYQRRSLPPSAGTTSSQQHQSQPQLAAPPSLPQLTSDEPSSVVEPPDDHDHHTQSYDMTFLTNMQADRSDDEEEDDETIANERSIRVDETD